MFRNFKQFINQFFYFFFICPVWFNFYKIALTVFYKLKNAYSWRPSIFSKANIVSVLSYLLAFIYIFSPFCLKYGFAFSASQDVFKSEDGVFMFGKFISNNDVTGLLGVIKKVKGRGECLLKRFESIMRKFSLWVSSLVEPIEETEEKAENRQEARNPEIRIYSDQEAHHFPKVLGFIVSQLIIWYVLLSRFS